MRGTWRWILAAAAVLAFVAAGWAIEEATRDDDGDTAYQGLTTGEGNPIQVTADAYGRLWVNVASGTAGVHTEDAAHASGDKGVMTLSVRTDTRAALAGTTGDYAPLQLTANGDLRTRDDDLNTATGTATTAAVDGDAAGSAVAHLRGINKKLAAGVGVTDTNGAAIAADLNELTAAPVAKNWVMGGAVVAAGPAPAPLAASETFARKVIMTAVKAAGTANTSVVYIGDANLVDTTAACIQLAPGDSFTIEGGPGTKFDLNLLRIDGATAADGVRYIYQPI